jgi:hypothetical protein
MRKAFRAAAGGFGALGLGWLFAADEFLAVSRTGDTFTFTLIVRGEIVGFMSLGWPMVTARSWINFVGNR